MCYEENYESPLGKMIMMSDGDSLTGLFFKIKNKNLRVDHIKKEIPIFKETKYWLDTYFGGDIPSFIPKITINASEFRRRVWEILLEIPYGCTTTYGEIAKQIAKERNIRKMSAQAIGGAVGHNPISIIIPCHRVIGVNGSLIGYSAGLDKKTKLLSLEKNKILL